LFVVNTEYFRKLKDSLLLEGQREIDAASLQTVTPMASLYKSKRTHTHKKKPYTWMQFVYTAHTLVSSNTNKKTTTGLSKSSFPPQISNKKSKNQKSKNQKIQCPPRLFLQNTNMCTNL